MYEFDEEGQEFANINENVDQVLSEIDGESESEDSSEDVENSQKLMNEALFKIELANMWKTLITQNIFTENSARKEIVDYANKSVKKFAMKQLEDALGMKKEEPKREPVQSSLLFNQEELYVLKMLIGKVLKQDTVSAMVNVEKKPEIATIKTTVNQPTINAPSDDNKTKRKRKNSAEQAISADAEEVTRTEQNQQSVKKPRKNIKKKDYVLPSDVSNMKPMPTAAQLIQQGVFSTPKMVVRGENVSQQQINQGKNTLGQIINNLTNGGQAIAVDNSKPADSVVEGGGDVNERF